jgi:hypothetical protein
MSNAMSRSKSRWKGALLATVAGAAIAPLSARAANSLVVSLGVSQNGNILSSNAYADPYDPVQINVYATVNGSALPSTSYVDGLQYLYYNVNAAFTAGQTTGMGAFTNAQLSPLFGGTAFNNGGGGVTNGTGAQPGNVSSAAISAVPSVVVGDASNQAIMAKPRTANPIYYDGTNTSNPYVTVSGNSVKFLVETLTFQPNTAAINAFFAGNTGSFAATHPNTMSFNVSVPSLAASYANTNYFVGMPGTPGAGSPAGTSNTSSTAYTASPTTVNLTDALPGDVNLDGTVNIQDFNILNGNFGTGTSGWTHGDLNNDGSVNIQDFNILNGNFGQSLITGAPAGIALPSALLAEIQAEAGAVPEPTSALLLAGGAMFSLLRRRRVAR